MRYVVPVSRMCSLLVVAAFSTLALVLAACGGSANPPAALALNLSGLPGGTVDAAYSATAAATGGTAPYTYMLTTGSLPPGLAVSASGAITGTPSKAGTFAFAIQATDSKGATATGQGSIVIAPATALTISPATLSDGQLNVAYSQTLTAGGGVAPYTFSVTAGTLPAGITLSPTGVLSGTPTSSGTFNFTIQAQDSTSPTPLSGSISYTLNISASSLTITPATLPDGTVNVAYNQVLMASGGKAPYKFSIAGTTTILQGGIALAPGGFFTGAPTTAGTITFTVQVEDSTTPTPLSGSISYTLTVNGASVTGNALLNGQYFFREQFYDYLNVANAAKADYKGPARHGFFTQWAQALANPLPHHAPAAARPAARAIPEQGSFNSPIVWGAIGASVTFDGNGKVTAGEFDSTSSYGTTNSTLTGTYSINPDYTGTMTLFLAGSTNPLTFNIALRDISGTTGKALAMAVIENTPLDGVGDVEYGTGVMAYQHPDDFNSATLDGAFIFEQRGETCYTCAQAQQGDIYAVGLLGLDGGSNVTGESQADITTNFANDSTVTLSGTFTAPDAMGRATLSLTTNGYSNGSLPQSYAIYITGNENIFLISTDAATNSNPYPAYLWGKAELQDESIDYANSSLNGNYGLYGNTEDLVNETMPDTASDAFIYLVAADGNGSISGTGDLNLAGTASSGVPLGGTYSVSPLGRMTTTGFNVANVNGGATPICWLASAADAYCLQQSSGSTQEPGLFRIYNQLDGPFTDGSIAGQFGVTSQSTSTGSSVVLSGVLISDGNGTLTGDLSFVSYYASGGGNDSAQYSISSNGRGTITGASGGTIGSGVFYVLTPSLAITLDETPGDVAPGLVFLER